MSACEKCGRPHWDGNLEALTELRAEAASLRERLEAAEAASYAKIEHLDRQVFELGELRARAIAAEGERDRLREALDRWIKRAETVRDNPEASTGAQDAAIAMLTALRAIREAYLAAIPHTEGEASASPKETTP